MECAQRFFRLIDKGMIIFKINHHHRITDMMNADTGFLQLFAEEHILVAVMLEVFVKRNTKHDIPLNGS